jgi:DNA-directed RNA polymerase specialized sigma24 family protein
MDVTAAGHIRLNGPPDLEPWDVPPDESCALDLADRDGMTLEAIGNVMNITRERVRQIETDALQKLDEEQDYEDYDTEERQ